MTPPPKLKSKAERILRFCRTLSTLVADEHTILILVWKP